MMCGKAYANSHLLRQHMEKVHPELPPQGTVLSTQARKKVERRELRVVQIRQELGLSFIDDSFIIQKLSLFTKTFARTLNKTY